MQANFNKLINYGFKLNKDYYEYETFLCDKAFKLLVTCDKNGNLCDRVFDAETNEEYLPLKIDSYVGEYVNKVRYEYNKAINSIMKECFDVFNGKYTQEVISYVKNKYGDELEFLWENDDNAVFRHKETKKWYGVILRVSKDKFGFDSKEKIEVLDLKNKPEVIDQLVDDKLFFRGYHMNKKHWFTCFLDGSVSLDKIKQYIDESYNM